MTVFGNMNNAESVLKDIIDYVMMLEETIELMDESEAPKVLGLIVKAVKMNGKRVRKTCKNCSIRIPFTELSSHKCKIGKPNGLSRLVDKHPEDEEPIRV